MAELETFLLARRFYLLRSEDESGVSGTGVIAVGVVWPSGHCSLEWLREPRTQGWYEKLEHVEQVHGHNGKTSVIFLDEPYEAVDDPERRYRGRST